MSVLHSEPTLTLTRAEARMLYQSARLNELRIRHRSGDTRLYALLVSIYKLALMSDAAPGTEPRQDTASEEREWWTTQQIARATRQAERTVRLACQENRLPATKTAGAWQIKAADAITYIQAHAAA